jgi:hypothetical protein
LSIGGLTLGGTGGGLSLGGLTLGGNKQGGQKSNATAAAGERASGVKLGGAQSQNATAPAAEAKAPTKEAEKPAEEVAKPPAAETEKPAKETLAEGEKSAPVEAAPKKGAGAGTENQPGRAEGEAAKEEALKEAGQGEAAAQEKSNGVKATEESERFSEEIGITLDEAGNAVNSGGNLGITQGSDGSKSVGGENGINIAASGKVTLAGNE